MYLHAVLRDLRGRTGPHLNRYQAMAMVLPHAQSAHEIRAVRSQPNRHPRYHQARCRTCRCPPQYRRSVDVKQFDTMPLGKPQLASASDLAVVARTGAFAP